MPWYTMDDDFDTEFGVDEWPRHETRSSRDGDSVFRHIIHQQPRRTRRWGALGATST